MEIKLTDNQTDGIAIATENGVVAGKMTYTKPSKEYIIVDHTEVSTQFKGTGVGKKLLYKVVEMAREKNVKIVPACSFVDVMFQRLDDIDDVLKE